ncbi:vWA domain-containing protein [Roseospira goensis]|uniref:Ca-activated chloride channel family protein n=1 Tax=Roseospira goensis TaxID=391922 RepID=A0A7W6S0H9_9PROT|nr:VWA domain-containing protein [Roseospira goensis]MBB4286641.1 Ca-activated chloride channel family protein [Roseospira goensis]
MSPRRACPGRAARAALAALTAALALAAAPAPARAQSDDAARTVLVLDASGSMWQQIAGGHKITVARQVVGDLLDSMPADQTLGLWAYGHTRKGDCGDIEELVPAGTGNRDAIRAAVEGLNPKGKTPLSDAVRRAAEALRYEENPATVVLISDGRETCDRDPCAVADDLEAAGIAFTAHVVGFDVNAPEDQAQLRCLAENTGGTFRTAADAASLKDALVAVTAAPAPTPEPEPEPEPEPAPPEITLTVPETATAGSRFMVERSATVKGSDYLTIVPMGTPEGELGNYSRVRDDNPLDLQAPAEPGLYEVRYVLEEGRRTLGRAPIELTGAEITLTVPETATAGSRFMVERSATVKGSDYLTIVPMGTREGELGNYSRVRDDNPLDLQAPAEPGLYEVRYVLEEGRRTLGRAPIELTGAEVTLTVPETVPAGGPLDVRRSATVKGSDYLTIVPMGTAEGELGPYARVRDDDPQRLTAPNDPGLYEVRYVLEEGRITAGRAPVEVVPVSATLTAPAEVVTGAALDLSWEGPNRRKDRIELVPAGAPPDAEPLAQTRADRGDSARFTAPDAEGAYTLRYRLGETGAIVASVDVAVKAVAASLTAPETAAPGATVRVRWTGPGGARDRIAVAAADQGPFQWLAAVGVRTDEGDGVALALPNDAGQYEVRYVDVANGVVLATRPITVQ